MPTRRADRGLRADRLVVQIDHSFSFPFSLSLWLSNDHLAGFVRMAVLVAAEGKL